MEVHTSRDNIIPLHSLLRLRKDALPEAPKPVRAFMRALQRFELTGRVGTLIALFSEEIELQSNLRILPVYGIAGAYRFWRDHIFEYQSIETRFERVSQIGDGDEYLLEWEASATLSRGERVQIRGITVLELKDGKVARYRSFSNRAAFRDVDARLAA